MPGPTWQNDPAKTSSANMWGTNEINEKNQNMRETYRTMSPMWHSKTLSQRKRTIQPLLLPKHTFHQTLQFAANKTKSGPKETLPVGNELNTKSVEARWLEECAAARDVPAASFLEALHSLKERPDGYLPLFVRRL